MNNQILQSDENLKETMNDQNASPVNITPNNLLRA